MMKTLSFTRNQIHILNKMAYKTGIFNVFNRNDLLIFNVDEESKTIKVSSDLITTFNKNVRIIVDVRLHKDDTFSVHRGLNVARAKLTAKILQHMLIEFNNDMSPIISLMKSVRAEYNDEILALRKYITK